MAVLSVYGNVIAYARYSESADGTIEIDQLAVADSYCGRGLGSYLVDTILTWCDARGYRRVWLWSLAEAEGFWARTGFNATTALADGRIRMTITVDDGDALSSVRSDSVPSIDTLYSQ